MPKDRNSDDAEGDAPKPSLWLRFQNAVVKPDDAAAEKRAKAASDDRPLAEIEAEIARANDKERAIGLVAAPLAALIGIIVAGDQIDNAINHNQSTAVFHTLLWVLALMAVLMLVTALLRKRLLLGIVTALFGLGIFNLHYWGFGVPFVMIGAWLLMRSYRLEQSRKRAGGETGSQRGSATPRTSLPRPNKRYTPPTAPARRPAKPKPDKEQQAG
jgi:hypothetical protein